MGPAATAAGIKIVRNGGVNLVMMISSDQDLLSARASVIWIAALCTVLAVHCGHLIRLRGEHRWYHASHVAMLLGMLYMYASVAFGLDWFPARVWVIIYAATSAAIVGWMLARFRQRQSFGYLWIVALVQQAAMIYMWAPMTDWAPRFTFALAVYFTLEAIAWLTRACIRSVAGNPVAQAGGSLAIPLAPKSAFGGVCMMIMAASMAYMFAGMQLMMSTRRQSPQLAQRPAPYEGRSSSGAEEAESPPLLQAPETAAKEPARLSAGSSPPVAAASYIVAAGDSVSRIAARLYGDARRWRSIIQANPGLDPRRLRIGQVIKLPTALSPQLPDGRSGSRNRGPASKLSRLTH
jgi:LysM repeat protein